MNFFLMLIGYLNVLSGPTFDHWPRGCRVLFLGKSNDMDLKQSTTGMATRAPPNKTFDEQNNNCARAL